MKRCSTCNRTYTEPNLSYCIDDGTPLIPVSVEDNDSTVVSPSQRSGQQDWNAPAYRPPSAYVPPDGGEQRRVWPWVVGIFAFLLVVFAGLGVSAWFLLPQLARQSTNRNQEVPADPNANTRTVPEESTNSNRNSNRAPTNDDTISGNTNTDAPTDKEVVLAQLTDLEQEWTVANINADKRKLDEILADDYAGPDINGRMQGKREYIRDIKRDTSTERWQFEDLKLRLRGDRASLTGKVRLTVSGEEKVFEFTDKFVWRDGRWQATSSVVSAAD